MDISKIKSVLIKIFTDYRVIIIFVFVILYLNFVMYVTKYRKIDRSALRRKKSAKKVQEVVIPTPENTEDANQENAADNEK